MHNPESVKENEWQKFLRGFAIPTDPLILARRPDLVRVNSKKKKKEPVE